MLMHVKSQQAVFLSCYGGNRNQKFGRNEKSQICNLIWDVLVSPESEFAQKIYRELDSFKISDCICDPLLCCSRPSS